MIEFYFWLATIYGCGIAHSILAFKWHNIDVPRLTVSIAHAKLSSKLAFANGINYFAFGFLAVYAIMFYGHYVPIALEILKEWWIVEAFILWNLRTIGLVIIGLWKVKVHL